MGVPDMGPTKLNWPNIGKDRIRHDKEIDLPALPLKAGGFAFGVASDFGREAVEPARVRESRDGAGRGGTIGPTGGGTEGRGGGWGGVFIVTVVVIAVNVCGPLDVPARAPTRVRPITFARLAAPWAGIVTREIVSARLGEEVARGPFAARAFVARAAARGG